MDDILIGFAINLLLDRVLKDPKKKEKFKAALLKVARGISAAFPGEVCQ